MAHGIFQAQVYPLFFHILLTQNECGPFSDEWLPDGIWKITNLCHVLMHKIQLMGNLWTQMSMTHYQWLICIPYIYLIQDLLFTWVKHVLPFKCCSVFFVFIFFFLLMRRRNRWKMQWTTLVMHHCSNLWYFIQYISISGPQLYFE